MNWMQFQIIYVINDVGRYYTGFCVNEQLALQTDILLIIIYMTCSACTLQSSIKILMEKYEFHFSLPL